MYATLAKLAGIAAGKVIKPPSPVTKPAALALPTCHAISDSMALVDRQIAAVIPRHILD
jgi:hypothetical protein